MVAKRLVVSTISSTLSLVLLALIYLISENSFTEQEFVETEVEVILAANAKSKDFETMFKRRRDNLVAVCRRRFNKSPYNDNASSMEPSKKYLKRWQYKFIVVDEKHKLVFCSLPKVASTNWRKVFVMLGSKPLEYIDYSEIPDDKVHDVRFTKRYFNLLSDYPKYSIDDVARILANYTKIMFVREPLARLVSVWRDKFQDGNNTHYNTIARHEMMSHDDSSNNSSHRSFTQFLKQVNEDYELEEANLAKGKPIDVHWESGMKHCLPCDIPYDYIGHFENIVNESNFLLRKLVPTRSDRFPPAAPKHHQQNEHDDDVFSLFNQVPLRLQRAITDHYRIDYEAFGYKLPI